MLISTLPLSRILICLHPHLHLDDHHHQILPVVALILQTNRNRIPLYTTVLPDYLRADYYPPWKVEAQIHLDNAHVWEVVSGSEVYSSIDTHSWYQKIANRDEPILAQKPNKTKRIKPVSSCVSSRDPEATSNISALSMCIYGSTFKAGE